MTQGDEVIPMILKRDGVKRSENTTFGNFETNYGFDSTALNYDWMTLRTPATDLYSLSDNTNYLTLKCADVSSMEKKTPAFISRRIQHHKFECTTRIYFEPADNQDAAGLLLFKDESHQYFLSIGKVDTKKMVSLIQISDSGSKELVSRAIAGKGAMLLKIISQGTYYDFYYATDDEKWEPLYQNISAQYLSTASTGGFTGTTIGMYATKKIIP